MASIESEYRNAKAWIDGLLRGKKCPLCDSPDSFTVGAAGFLIVEGVGDHFDPTTQAFPVNARVRVMTARCRKCAHLLLFDLADASSQRPPHVR